MVKFAAPVWSTGVQVLEQEAEQADRQHQLTLGIQAASEPLGSKQHHIATAGPERRLVNLRAAGGGFYIAANKRTEGW